MNEGYKSKGLELGIKSLMSRLYYTDLSFNLGSSKERRRRKRKAQARRRSTT